MHGKGVLGKEFDSLTDSFYFLVYVCTALVVVIVWLICLMGEIRILLEARLLGH